MFTMFAEKIMKTIGLIGGLSWHSTIGYYSIINQIVNQRLGGSHSAKILLYSADLEEFKSSQEQGAWIRIEQMLSEITVKLQNAGSECLAFASNTPHVVADRIAQRLSIPLLHIAEETAKEIVKHDIVKVGLLGTRFTMGSSFFTDHLRKNGIETLVSNSDDRNFIHETIFGELTKGMVTHSTKIRYLKIIERLKVSGANGIILGCTELSLLINQTSIDLKLFDTTDIHARAIADFALS